jgi:tRNA dimethylallyltransferase
MKPLLVILGPTASGKTGLAIELARALNGEILNADSRQVYRQMDIGTAKPSAAQQALAPHHLLDLVAPDALFAVADFLDQARPCIEALHAQGKLPIVAGGTGQYITALLEGWTIPRVPPDDALRAELNAFAETAGAAALHERLRALDAPSADAIDFRNVRRVVRALEVCMTTGQRMSDLQRKQPPPWHVRQIGLTMDREALYARADVRFDEMMRVGFLQEVRDLLAAGYARTLPAMSGLGYAELCAHLLDGEPLDAAVARAKHNTHDFIRRQYTWFRKYNTDADWRDSTQVDITRLVQSLREWMEEAADAISTTRTIP